MYVASLAALCAVLIVFIWIGLRARTAAGDLDDYLTARNSQGASALGLSFLASGLGAWILFAPPEVGAFVGPLAVAGYAVGAALPFLVFAWCGGAIRRRLPKGRSIGEFAHARFGAGVRRWVALISVLYMLCFLTAELTAIGAIAGMLAGLPAAWPVVAVAVATLIYTTWGGLRASIVTDRWQAGLLIALLVLIGGTVIDRMPQTSQPWVWPSAPAGQAWSVALTLVIAVTAANLFHQGYWQRVWAARDPRSLNAGAVLGALTTVAAVGLVGFFGMMAAASGADMGQPPAPFFALLRGSAPWVTVLTLVLAVALVASSVDTLQNGIASLMVGEGVAPTLSGARWITVLLMLPVIAVALQGLSVLRLFLIADLLCATAVVPVLLGLWGRASAPAAIAGAAAGLAGAVLPGWISTGSLSAGALAATFPGSIPTLAPFAGALVASTAVSVGVTLIWPRPQKGYAANADVRS